MSSQRLVISEVITLAGIPAGVPRPVPLPRPVLAKSRVPCPHRKDARDGAERRLPCVFSRAAVELLINEPLRTEGARPGQNGGRHDVRTIAALRHNRRTTMESGS